MHFRAELQTMQRSSVFFCSACRHLPSYISRRLSCAPSSLFFILLRGSLAVPPATALASLAYKYSLFNQPRKLRISISNPMNMRTAPPRISARLDSRFPIFFPMRRPPMHIAYVTAAIMVADSSAACQP